MATSTVIDESAPFTLRVLGHFIGIEMYVCPEGKGAFIGGFRRAGTKALDNGETRGPAELSGKVRPGDILLRANEVVLKDMNLTEIVATINSQERPLSLLLLHTSFLKPTLVRVDKFLSSPSLVEPYFRFIETRFQPRGFRKTEVATLRDRLRYEQSKIMFLLEANHYEAITDSEGRVALAMKMHEKYFSTKSQFRLEKSIRDKGQKIVLKSKLAVTKAGEKGGACNYSWATFNLFFPIVSDVKLSLVHLFSAFSREYKSSRLHSCVSPQLKKGAEEFTWTLQRILDQGGWKYYFLVFLLQTRQHNSFVYYESLNDLLIRGKEDCLEEADFLFLCRSCNNRFINYDSALYVVCLDRELRQGLKNAGRRIEFLHLLEKAKSQVFAYLSQFWVQFQASGLYSLMKDNQNKRMQASTLLKLLQAKLIDRNGLLIKQIGIKEQEVIKERNATNLQTQYTPVVQEPSTTLIEGAYFVSHDLRAEKTKIIPLLPVLANDDSAFHNLDMFFLPDKKILVKRNAEAMESFYFVLSGSTRSDAGQYTFGTCLRYTAPKDIVAPHTSKKALSSSPLGNVSSDQKPNAIGANTRGYPNSSSNDESRSAASPFTDSRINESDMPELTERHMASPCRVVDHSILVSGIILLSKNLFSAAYLRDHLIRDFRHHAIFRETIIKGEIDGNDIAGLTQCIADFSHACTEGNSVIIRNGEMQRRQASLVMSLLSPYSIARIMSQLLLERKIILVSSNKSTLVYVSEFFRDVLKPLNWTHVYAPLLPHALIDNLECPTPFIMGNIGYVESFQVLDLMKTDDTICVVDLNKGIVHANRNVEMSSISFVKKLANEIMNAGVYCKLNCHDECSESNESRDVGSICRAAVQSLIFDYKDYVISFDLARSGTSKLANVVLFDDAAFQKSRAKSVYQRGMQKFYASFTQTQLFSSLITDSFA